MAKNTGKRLEGDVENFYKRTFCHICLLSFVPTQRILLSPTSQQRPGCQQYGNQRFHNSMDLQPMTTSYCRHSPSLSREGNVSQTFLLHSSPLLDKGIVKRLSINMLESRFTMLFNFIGHLICMTAPGLPVFSNPSAQFSNPSYFLIPAFQNSDS